MFYLGACALKSGGGADDRTIFEWFGTPRCSAPCQRRVAINSKKGKPQYNLRSLNMNESKRNVTLTNWERISNAPIDLSKCSAVQWRREFIAVSNSDGNTLLYNVKWNMWSQLAKLPDGTKPCQGCPLTCYDEKLLILTQGGKIYELLPEKNQWRVNQTLTSNQFGRSLDVIILIVLATGSESTLFAIYHGGSYRTSSILQVFDGSFWSDPVSLQLNVLENRLEHKHISIAVQK